ncbi:GntR family transcriptional regulator [Tropicibacter naphthalenivorans]|uniref:HTH-type transcriptional repressor YvoA n=1 Tax=Tropicibacter naphthalenivorans TaxID=441103 RepID=A0A0P1GBN7_9RHOB|nr:GntR family transcriptional regulator [Tropicibacter naphthalenivorans]CUH78779.1 HTH-type transcriptional repressor YvoA [Tropicibacter naphthalenivorans]SMC81510.1 transcriptional regulator, GntR family [Tropicibacter naphthalenivorans]
MTDRHALPLYLQISEMLIREIGAGRLADGARLPPERDYAAQLGISVGTLRKALGDLADKGLLRRVQGSGNYIRAKADVQSVYAFFRVELLEGGGLPTADVLSLDRVTKSADLPDFGASAQAWRIRRLRRLNGIPAVLDEVWLDASYAPSLTVRDLSDSLYLTYREKLNLWITSAEDRMSIAPVPDWAPAEFGPKPGVQMLLATRVSLTADGTRAEVSRGYIDTSVATYIARLK